MTTLTKAQAKRLQEIVAYVPTERWPLPAFWKGSPTDRSLLKREFVERVDHSTKLGGPRDALSMTSVTWNLCRITDAGRAALAESAP